MKIKPEQFLIGAAVVIGGIWLLYQLAPKAPAPISVGTPPIAGGSGVGQSGALGAAVGSLVNILASSKASSSNQQAPQPDFSL